MLCFFKQILLDIIRSWGGEPVLASPGGNHVSGTSRWPLKVRGIPIQDASNHQKIITDSIWFPVAFDQINRIHHYPFICSAKNVDSSFKVWMPIWQVLPRMQQPQKTLTLLRLQAPLRGSASSCCSRPSMLVLPEKTVSNESGEEDVVKSLALEELYMFRYFQTKVYFNLQPKPKPKPFFNKLPSNVIAIRQLSMNQLPTQPSFAFSTGYPWTPYASSQVHWPARSHDRASVWIHLVFYQVFQWWAPT